MKDLKMYIAGKVSPDSVFGKHDWRDGFCSQLSELSGFRITNLDPTKSHDDFHLDENNSRLIFWRDCFMISMADVVVVNLTDDISVGGSQEMLIAKYYRKPLIGIAPKGGKFHKSETGILGNSYINWIHPFVSIPCDKVVHDIVELADFLKILDNSQIKDISIIEESRQYYMDHHYRNDAFVNSLSV